MTTLIISNKPVLLPSDLETTLCFENPYFTRTSNYSLEVTLPMPANYGIFGHIHRQDVKKEKVILTAKLIVDGRVLMNGSAVVIAVDDTSVTVQLMSGNAEFNILTNDDIYIDLLDFGKVGYPPFPQGADINFPFEDKVKIYGPVDNVTSVWLPVLYNDEDLYNDVVFDFGTNKFCTTDRRIRYCVQPYLLTVVRKIIEYFGYKEGENYLDQCWMRNLYIVSAVQTTKINGALPHWTVSQFFDELEKFCGVITVVDELTKTISLIDINTYYSTSEYEYIDNVLKEFDTDIDDESEGKDVTTGNVGYQLPSGTDDGYFRLDRDLIRVASKTEFDTYQKLESYYNALSDANKKYALLICNGRYYINYNDGSNKLREVNLYADLIRDEDSEDVDVELKIVPAKILQYNIGLYMNYPNYLTNNKMWPLVLNVPSASFHTELGKEDKVSIQDVIEGNQELQTNREKKDIIELAIYTGELHPVEVNYKGQLATYHYPFPFTDYKQTVPNQQDALPKYSLSLNDLGDGSMGHRMRDIRAIHSNVPYTIQFEKKWIPKLNRIFVINNKRYVAKKIEAQMTSRELVPILKGTFYRLD